MKFTAQVLSASEQQRVHEESLRILAEVGVKFLGKTALPLLKKAGASVDEDSRIVRLPREQVVEALQTAPRSFTLGARNPAYDYPLPSQVTRYGLDGTAAFALDFHTGERRYGTLQDIEHGLRIFQQLDMGVMAWAPTAASETPAHSRALHEFFAMAKFCSKHGEHELHFSNQVPYLVAGLQAVMGSVEALRSGAPDDVQVMAKPPDLPRLRASEHRDLEQPGDVEAVLARIHVDGSGEGGAGRAQRPGELCRWTWRSMDGSGTLRPRTTPVTSPGSEEAAGFRCIAPRW